MDRRHTGNCERCRKPCSSRLCAGCAALCARIRSGKTRNRPNNMRTRVAAAIERERAKFSRGPLVQCGECGVKVESSAALLGHLARSHGHVGKVGAK